MTIKEQRELEDYFLKSRDEIIQSREIIKQQKERIAFFGKTCN